MTALSKALVYKDERSILAMGLECLIQAAAAAVGAD